MMGFWRKEMKTNETAVLYGAGLDSDCRFHGVHGDGHAVGSRMKKSAGSDGHRSQRTRKEF